MRRALAAAMALALPVPALAQDAATEIRFAPDYAWVAGPGARPGADSPIRIVPQAGQGQAAMSVNQYDAYQRAYRRELARLSLRLPIAEAEAGARRAAWAEVVRADPATAIRRLETAPIDTDVRPIPAAVE
jgi:hypothetical protein